MRLTFDEYFMKICDIVSQRATCPRKNVGAVVVKDGRILSTGYNGSPKGFKHCTEIGCHLKNNHCMRVIHAEQNALLFAGREANGSVLYCTTLPCEHCMKMAIQQGIKKIVYKEEYNKEDIQWLLNETTIEITRFKEE